MVIYSSLTLTAVFGIYDPFAAERLLSLARRFNAAPRLTDAISKALGM